MVKNKTFDLFGEKWQLKYVDHIETDENRFCYGTTDTNNKLILIATKDINGDNMSETTMHITLLHEIMHCILGSGAYETSCRDEPLVEWCARCLHHLMTKKVI